MKKEAKKILEKVLLINRSVRHPLIEGIMIKDIRFEEEDEKIIITVRDGKSVISQVIPKKVISEEEKAVEKIKDKSIMGIPVLSLIAVFAPGESLVSYVDEKPFIMEAIESALKKIIREEKKFVKVDEIPVKVTGHLWNETAAALARDHKKLEELKREPKGFARVRAIIFEDNTKLAMLPLQSAYLDDYYMCLLDEGNNIRKCIHYLTFEGGPDIYHLPDQEPRVETVPILPGWDGFRYGAYKKFSKSKKL